MKIKDLQQNRFGYLMAISSMFTKGRTYWSCRCDCGNLKLVSYSNLINGSTKSCGCKTGLIWAENTRKDIVGKKFNRLLVINFSNIKNHKSVWKCLCNCGKEIYVTTGHLTSGHTKSCGCLDAEHRQQFIKDFAYKKGKDHPNYDPNLTPEDRIRNRNNQTKWSEQVKIRDNFICQICNKINVKLHAHHLDSYSIYKNKRLDINNGITLCDICHIEFHKIYGQITIKEDYEKFKEFKRKQYEKE